MMAIKTYQRKLWAEENSAWFFRNTACAHFPCHDTDVAWFNCLFCFCPLYAEECPGTPGYINHGGRRCKDCSGCMYPHQPENYRGMMALIGGSGEGELA